jgi:hypothetical protein
MLYNLKDPNMLAQIVEMVESSYNQDRISKHLTDYQIVNGNQHEHIKEALFLRYPDSWSTMVIVNIAIAKKIIRKLARVYANGVKREIINKKDGSINDKMTSLINYIYEDIDENEDSFNDIMVKMNEYYENHEYAELYT